MQGSESTKFESELSRPTEIDQLASALLRCIRIRLPRGKTLRKPT